MGRSGLRAIVRVSGVALLMQLASATPSAAATPTRPAAPTPTPPATPTPTYTAARSTASPPASGTNDIHNHCDDCATTFAPGFSVKLYGRAVSTLHVAANGNAQSNSTAPDPASTALPNSDFGLTVFPFWDDLRTDTPGSGVFSAVLGTSGSRALVLEWRATMFATGEPVDVTLVLHENTSNFEIYYSTLPANAGATATEGVQFNGVGPATQWASRSGVLVAGEEVAYTVSAPPSVTKAPSVALAVGGQVGTSPRGVALAISVSWADTPGSAPLCSTTLEREVNGGSWTSVPVASATATSTTDLLTVNGAHYDYRVQLAGCDGSSSGWATAPSFTYNLAQESSSPWSYSPTPAWKLITCASCSAGRAELSASAGAIARLSVSKAIAAGLVMETGPQYGEATVTIDGAMFSVTTSAASDGYRVVVLAHEWASPGAHSVEVQNQATPGHPELQLDAAAVLTSP